MKTIILLTILMIFQSNYNWGQSVLFKNEKGLEGQKDEKTGQILIQPIYKQLTSFKGGKYVATLPNNKTGLIDEKGKTIIPFKFDAIFCCDDKGLYKVELNNKFGYVNKKGKTKISIIYDNVYLFYKDKAKVVLNGKSMFVNRKGQKVNRKGERIK